MPTASAFSDPVPSVGHLVRGAALDSLRAAVQEAHGAGNTALRDALAARWRAAVFAGVGSWRGIASLSHAA